jgi:enoyl-CoA hydratase/carnithine racemase
MVFGTPPPHSEELKLLFPSEHVMLLVLNRPKALNAMSPSLEADIKRVLDWFDEEPELWYLLETPS